MASARDQALAILKATYPTPKDFKDPNLIYSELKYSNELSNYSDRQTGLRFLKQTIEIRDNKELEYYLAKNRFMNNLSTHREILENANNITPIKEFGTNYAEFYHDGIGAVKKLLIEKQGQVAGAFRRDELGDIDLVY